MYLYLPVWKSGLFPPIFTGLWGNFQKVADARICRRSQAVHDSGCTITFSHFCPIIPCLCVALILSQWHCSQQGLSMAYVTTKISAIFELIVTLYLGRIFWSLFCHQWNGYSKKDQHICPLQTWKLFVKKNFLKTVMEIIFRKLELQ